MLLSGSLNEGNVRAAVCFKFKLMILGVVGTNAGGLLITIK